MKKIEVIDNSSNEDKKNKKEVIRQPRQARSIETKRKILDTALKLFCENGFYKTTTNEIAKQSNVPIGSLYSYFKNKDMILFEILDDYAKIFINRVHKLNNAESIQNVRMDKKAWIRESMELLIELHEETKDFNLELQGLYHSMPQVAAMHDAHDLEIQKRIMMEFEPFKDEMKVTDFEAAAIVTNDIISSLVDRIVFTNIEIDRERIINCGVEAVYKYLFC